MKSSELDLTGDAALAASLLESEFPGIEFTSGRRTIEKQSFAMAENVVRDPKWIDVYRESAPVSAVKAWLGCHSCTDISLVAAGILSVLKRFDDDELSHLSKHLAGEAFDVRPMNGLRGRLIHSAMTRIARKFGGKFLDHEGGIIIWHMQF